MDFDLNLKNYKINELEEIFSLPKGYSATLLNNRENKLKQSISNNKTIQSEEKKNKIIEFIVDAKNKIMEELSKNINQIQTLKKTYDNIYNVNPSLKKSDTLNDGGTFIIEKPFTPYGNSKPGEFYTGLLNPLSKAILRKSLNIDTRFRDNYHTSSSSNFHFDLPIKLSEVVSLQLVALELPNTIYSISKIFGNNYFVLTIGYGEDESDIYCNDYACDYELENQNQNQNQNQKIETQSVLIIIPDGNYTADSLKNYLNSFMESYSSSSDSLLSLLEYVVFNIDLGPVSSNNSTGKMNVGINSSYQGIPFVFGFKFNVDVSGQEDRINPLQMKFGWVMGFRECDYFGKSIYTSEGIVDLQGPKYIYLVIDDFNNNVNDGFIGAFKNSILNKNIIARICLQGGVNILSYLSQNNLALITYPRQYFGPVDILKLQIQLLDAYGKIIDLNNMDYSFCLTFQTVYDI
jgi:hypothetical protein